MLRRIVLGIAGLAFVCVTAVVALVARAPLDGGEAAALSALREATGLAIEANGRTTIALFPTPEVRIDGVSAAQNGQTPFAVARELVGAPRLVPLLAGRFELASVTLRSAQIALDRLPAGEAFSALARAPGLGFAVPEIRLVDARLTLGGREIEKVEGAMAWPGAGRPLAITGFGRFAGRPVEVAMTFADPAAIGRADGTPFRARLDGGGAHVVFDGSAADSDTGPRFDGALRVRAGSLRETLGWLGAPAPRRSSPLAGFSLAGEAIADRDGLSISTAELDLEGDSFLGAGRFTSVNGRPSVEATLDAETLNLKPYVAGLAPGVRDNGGWRTKPLDLTAIQGFDLDLRLSAGKVRAGAWRLSRMAATVGVAKGALDISIGEASAYGGSVSGRIGVDPDGGRALVRFEVATTDVRLADALKGLTPHPALAGALTAELNARGAGASIAEIVASLEGEGKTRVTDGAIEGFGSSRALALAGLRGGMAVSLADADVAIRDGVARTEDLRIVGSDATFALSGEASLVERDLKLEGFVRPTDGTWTLPVRIDGPFAAPRIRPNLSLNAPSGEARNARR